MFAPLRLQLYSHFPKFVLDVKRILGEEGDGVDIHQASAIVGILKDKIQVVPTVTFCQRERFFVEVFPGTIYLHRYASQQRSIHRSPTDFNRPTCACTRHADD